MCVCMCSTYSAYPQSQLMSSLLIHLLVMPYTLFPLMCFCCSTSIPHPSTNKLEAMCAKAVITTSFVANEMHNHLEWGLLRLPQIVCRINNNILSIYTIFRFTYSFECLSSGGLQLCGSLPVKWANETFKKLGHLCNICLCLLKWNLHSLVPRVKALNCLHALSNSLFNLVKQGEALIFSNKWLFIKNRNL